MVKDQGIYRKRDGACFAKDLDWNEAQKLLKLLETAYTLEWFEVRLWRGEEVIGKLTPDKKKKGR